MNIDQVIELISEAVLQDITDDDKVALMVEHFPNIREAIFKVLAGTL